MNQNQFKIEDIKIRRAHPSDFEEVAGLLFDVAMIHHTELPRIFKKPELSNPLVKQEFLRSVADKEFGYFVTIYENEIVGIAEVSIKIRKENHSVYSKRIATIEKLVTKRDFRNKGIGKDLMSGVLNWIKSQGNVDEVELNVWGFNKGAKKFYDDLGFKVKIFKMYKENRNE